jgi:hypothetical protein
MMKKLVLVAGALCAGVLHAERGVEQWTNVPLQRAEGEVTVARPAGAPALRVTFRIGDMAPAKLLIRKADGQQATLTLRNQADKWTVKRKQEGQTVTETFALPDAMIRFDPLVTRHVRPHLRRYTDAQQQALANRWEQLPSASQHAFTLELRQAGDAFERYLDGHYIGREVGVFDALIFRLSAAGSVLAAQAGAAAGDARYLPLEMRWIARPGVFSNAVPSLPSGLQTVAGVPLAVAAGAESGDVGQVRQMKGSWALECDEQLARTALDGMPESLHTAVPPAFYSRVWVLCAVDPDLARDPVVTVRMTRYAASGRGDAIGLDTLRLPRTPAEPLPERVRRVGSVAHHGANLPLYLVELDLKPGDLLDLLAMTADRQASMMSAPYLDIDFMGKPGSISAQWDTSRKPDNRSMSGVHLFGVTLEKMPVSIRIEQAQPGNIFHNGERPETFVRIRAEAAQARAVLRWTVSDAAGRDRRRRSERLVFDQVGEEQRIVVPLETDSPGWYGLRFEVTDTKGRVWLAHDAAFARLGSDTRQAGYESPFGTWWFGGAHYSGGELEIAGPMLFKAGLRKTTFGWTQLSEKDFAPWKVTLNQIGWIRPRSITNKEAAYAELEQKIGALVERFPHCNAATIFHESYNSRLPPELIGEEAAETPEEAAKARQMAELGNFMGQFYREKFPHIKLLVGNTTHSASIISALLRHGMKPEFIDWIGMETVGQTSMPEKLWSGGLQGIWLGRETARRLGHDLPVNGCYEFIARTERTLGQPRQAAFIARDILISLAYGFERVSPAIIMDTGNAYYNTLWGAGGLCRRYPLLYPKQAYVGVATATRVLDRATFAGKHETGSRTVYALAFRRADGREVTALWTTVGEADVEVAFAQRATVETVAFLGAADTRRARSQTVTVGTSPLYLVSDQPAGPVRVRRRRYAPPPPAFAVAESMTATNRWMLDPGDPAMNSRNPELPFRQPGSFNLRAVKDTEKGVCLEVALVKQGDLEPLISEYTFLKAVEPIAAPGTPTDIGLWIKGDSGWGKLVFEIEDANKTVWRTEGTWHDWPGDLSVNFDGWRFLRYPIDGSSTERNLSPSDRWNGGKGDPGFPIRLRGLYVVVNRQVLDPTEMREVPAVLRFKDIGFIHRQSTASMSNNRGRDAYETFGSQCDH